MMMEPASKAIVIAFLRLAEDRMYSATQLPVWSCEALATIAWLRGLLDRADLDFERWLAEVEDEVET